MREIIIRPFSFHKNREKCVRFYAISTGSRIDRLMTMGRNERAPLKACKKLRHKRKTLGIQHACIRYFGIASESRTGDSKAREALD